MLTSRTPLALGASFVLAATAQAQFTEIEPNDAKATASVAAGVSSGQTLTGLSISGTTSGIDYWLVSTALAPAGIYRHELTITTSGTAGHSATLRGLTSTGTSPTCTPPTPGTGGTVGTGESTLQTSSTATIPARMCAWYGFGKGEQIYYRVTGVAATTANYVATLTSTPLVPAVIPGSFGPGPITFTTNGIANSSDMEIHLFDSTLTAIPNGANDAEICWTDFFPATLTRTLAPGTYYIALGMYDTATSVPSAPDDDWAIANVWDFPGGIDCNVTATGQNMSVKLTDGVTTVTQAATQVSAFGVVFFQFNVGSTAVAVCDPGVGSVMACPCANPPAGTGRGCENSQATGGGSISATGSSSLATDTLVFSSANQTANGTTILLQGQVNDPNGFQFGQGVRCVAGVLKRLYVKSPGGTGGITAPSGADPTVSARSAALGDAISAGSHRYYMTYYRDPVVLGACSPALTFNGTNALDVTWN